MYRGWQLNTVITRVVSLVLVIVVYFSHWDSTYKIYNFKIPGAASLVYFMPWVALLLVGHTGLQLGFYAKSHILTSGMLSAFLPNNFRSLTHMKESNWGLFLTQTTNMHISDEPPWAERVATS